MKKLILVTLLCFGCSKEDTRQDVVPPPPPPKECLDTEPNNDGLQANFVDFVEKFDYIEFCGSAPNGNDMDFYQFAANSPLIFSSVIDYNSDSVMEAYIYVRDFITNEFMIVNHYFGDHGQLVILDQFVPVMNYGFYLALRPITGYDTHYKVEVWIK